MVKIYKLEIDEYVYVGSSVKPNRRLNTHESLLRRGIHYNNKLQEAYDKYSKVTLVILEETTEDLRGAREEYWIRKLRSPNLCNKSKGLGLKGLSHDGEFKKRLSDRMTGSSNPASTVKESKVLKVAELIVEGKSNKEIEVLTGLGFKYVSSIRNKKRHKWVWEVVKGDIPKSKGRSSLSYKKYCEIRELIKEGLTNKTIADRMGVDPSTISRIKSGKLYLEYKKTYEGGSTTIETDS